MYNASLRGIVVTHNYTDGVQTRRFRLSKQNKDEVSLPRLKAYALGTIPIKKDKLEDIGKLRCYIPVEHEPWFDTLQNWP